MMDNSQSSDILLENSMNYIDSPVLNSESYKSLLSRTKMFLSTECVINEPAFSLKFSSSLEDFCICISQCLDAIGNLLENVELNFSALCGYMEDAISLLQMLSHFIKNIIESMAISCTILKTFPTATGHIILTVFTHCKDSEILYGAHLNSVEKQLKDLFRSCHELQLTYLMTLEKHLIFDMTEKEQQNILLEALDINLRIGEIVQALDVKTMAEQWKAYTAICEKYSKSLMDNSIYNKCAKLLCVMIESNVTTALEKDEDDKIVLRSVKVASFIIKILLKVSCIFKHGSTNNYEHVLHLLIDIYLCDGSVLEGMLNKSQQFINQVNLLMLNPTQALLSQLSTDVRFLNCLLQCDIRQLKEDKQLGYILLLMSTIKSILQFTEEPSVALMFKPKVIDCIFNVIPYSSVWFNIGLKFKNKDGGETYGFEEQFLIHVVALCMSLGAEEFALVERHMYEALLSNDSCSALISSNLWVLLARAASRQYALTTVISLCKVYQTLETNPLFHNSPQEVHFSNTIPRLFENLPNEDKLLLNEDFDVQDQRYHGLWSVLKIKNLPVNVRIPVEEIIIDNLLVKLNKLIEANLNEERDLEELIKTIRLASTCAFVGFNEVENPLEEYVVKAWVKACPKSLFSLPINVHPGIHWYFKYVEALISLTNTVIDHFFYLENVVKVFNLLTNLILTGSNEFTQVVIPTFCKISLHLLLDEHNLSIDTTTNKIFKYLLLETDPLIKQYTLNELVKYKQQKKFKNIVLKIITESPALHEEWMRIFNDGTNITVRKEQWMLFAESIFVHKCVENKIERKDSVSIIKTKAQSNFELDIDNLFNGESDSDEPASKKAKIDTNVAEAIIERLENDTLLLSRIDDISNESKKRITFVYERLRNIIS